MSWKLKTLLLVMMTTALICGFLHHLVPPTAINFERLHIFLFNLCSGGTLLVYFTEGQPALSRRGVTFLALAVAFAVAAFLQWYPAAMLISLALAKLVEDEASTISAAAGPAACSRRGSGVARKFHQAALLCLSLGLLFSSPVILNSVYLKWWTIEKLKLDTFFLGFSFPISLISMSVIFRSCSMPASA